VTVDDVSYLMTVDKNFVDPFFLGSCGILGLDFELAIGVVEYSVAFPLPDVERLAVPRVYQTIYVVLQLVVDLRRKRL